jgi:hypothetical protein
MRHPLLCRAIHSLLFDIIAGHETPPGARLFVSNYIVRVELHSASDEDYALLHAQMKLRGFSQTILASDRSTYLLPAATYVMTLAAVTLDQASHVAIAAAQATGKEYSLIITNWTNAQWSGLPKI